MRTQFMKYTKIVIDSNDHKDIQLLRYINGYNSSTWHNWWLKCKVIDLQFASFSKITAYKNLLDFILNQIVLAKNLTSTNVL